MDENKEFFEIIGRLYVEAHRSATAAQQLQEIVKMQDEQIKMLKNEPSSKSINSQPDIDGIHATRSQSSVGETV